MTAEKIHAGVKLALTDFAGRGTALATSYSISITI